MEFTTVLKAVLLFYIIGNYGSKAATISVDFNHQGMVRVGTNITFTCRVEVADEVDPNSVTISIVKRAADKTEGITLNANKFGIYQKIDRYHIHRYPEGQVMIYELNIAGVQEEDSGQFGCVDPIEQGTAASASFMVFSDIDDVQFLGMDNNLTVWYEDEVNVTCLITSSVPEAMAHIHAGDYEYTDVFHKTVNNRIINDATNGQDEKPPMYIDYDTVYMATTFKARPEDDGKELSCTAHVPGIKGGPPPVKDSVKLEVSYPPIFFECKEKQYVLLHEEDAKLNCSVRYNPVGSANWTFTWGSTQVTLAPDESTEDGEITAKMMREQEGFNVHRMYLVINKVFERHFQTYTLQAKNKYGTQKIDIVLFEGEEPPSGSNSLLASYLLTLAVACISKLLWF